MKTALFSILGGILGVALVALGGLFMLRSPQPRDLPFDPYVAEPSQPESSVPVLFSKLDTFDLPLPTLTALVCGPDGILYAAGETTVLAADTRGNVQWRETTDAPVTALAVAPNHGAIWAALGDRVEKRTAQNQWQPIDVDTTPDTLITALAIREDHIALADAGNRQVLVITADGAIHHRFGQNTPNDQIELLLPSAHLDLGWTPEGTLIMTNPGRQQVMYVTPDGDPRSSWGHSSIEPDGFCGCCNPTHIVRLADGSVLTSEKGLPRVKLYTQDGVFLGFVDTPSNLKRPAGSNHQPYVITAGPDGRVYLADPATATLRVYKPRGGRG